MDDLKRVIIDNHELGERLGLKEEDVIRDGKVIMRDQVWTKEALTKAVAECRQRAAGADIVENRGHCDSWALAAMSYAVLPAVCYFEIGPGGMYKLTSTPFPVNAAGNDAVLKFDVREEGDKVWVTALSADPNADAHGFRMEDFDQIVMPPIPSGKHVFLAGEVVNPIAVSMVLTYADISQSVSIRFHREPDYVCSVSHCSQIEVGDRTPAE